MWNKRKMLDRASWSRSPCLLSLTCFALHAAAPAYCSSVQLGNVASSWLSAVEVQNAEQQLQQLQDVRYIKYRKWNPLGWVFSNQGHRPSAASCDVATVLEKNGNSTDAHAHYLMVSKETLSNTPTHWKAKLGQARCLTNLGRWQEAEECLSVYVETCPFVPSLVIMEDMLVIIPNGSTVEACQKQLDHVAAVLGEVLMKRSPVALVRTSSGIAFSQINFEDGDAIAQSPCWKNPFNPVRCVRTMTSQKELPWISLFYEGLKHLNNRQFAKAIPSLGAACGEFEMSFEDRADASDQITEDLLHTLGATLLFEQFQSVYVRCSIQQSKGLLSRAIKLLSRSGGLGLSTRRSITRCLMSIPDVDSIGAFLNKIHSNSSEEWGSHTQHSSEDGMLIIDTVDLEWAKNAHQFFSTLSEFSNDSSGVLARACECQITPSGVLLFPSLKMEEASILYSALVQSVLYKESDLSKLHRDTAIPIIEMGVSAGL